MSRPDPTLAALRGILAALLAIERANGRIEVRLQRLEAAAELRAEPPEVRAERVGLQVEGIRARRGALTWLRLAPGRAWRWLAADRVRLAALALVSIDAWARLSPGSALADYGRAMIATLAGP